MNLLVLASIGLNHETPLWRRPRAGLLLPEAVADYVAADNPVRFLDFFVAALDLHALGFAKAIPAYTGRPPYEPGDLLRLYLYGYLHRIRSSRALERECHRNLELIWLLRKPTPDFKTIADFRRGWRGSDWLLRLQPGEQLPRVAFIKVLHLFDGEFDCTHGEDATTATGMAANTPRAPEHWSRACEGTANSARTKDGHGFMVEFTTFDGTTVALTKVSAGQIRPLAPNEFITPIRSIGPFTDWNGHPTLAIPTRRDRKFWNRWACALSSLWMAHDEFFAAMN